MNTNAFKLTLCLVLSLIAVPKLFALTLIDEAIGGESVSELYEYEVTPPASVEATIYASSMSGSYATGTTLWIVPGLPETTVLSITASGNNTAHDRAETRSIPLGNCLILHVGTTRPGSNVRFITQTSW